MDLNKNEFYYWSLPTTTVLKQMATGSNGLTTEEAKKRLQEHGENTIQTKTRHTHLRLLANQFKNPIMIILFFASLVSALTREWFDAQIIWMIIGASAVLSFFQEYRASQAIKKLQSKVQFTCRVQRDGQFIDLPSHLVTPGDIVELTKGSLIPADGLLLTSEDLHVDQSVLTGESAAVEKTIEPVPANSTVEERTNCLYMGTNVFSGQATMLVVETGYQTKYGRIAEELTLRPQETDFEQGVRHFGYLLSEVMLILTFIVFATNVLLDKPAIDSLLFSVALAIGITPQLLPAITSITLSTGARKMAKKGVIVRRLNSIENFGSMDVLCTDKTGTLTEGNLQLDQATDLNGQESAAVFRLAYLNASLQKGMRNSLDEAIYHKQHLATGKVQKLDELAFDFNRRRLSVLFREGHQNQLVTKGAFNAILEICSFVNTAAGKSRIDESTKSHLLALYKDWSEEGLRVLGVAWKGDNLHDTVNLADEQNMIFAGFLLFSDHPKAGAASTIQKMNQKGVELKIITGDNHLLASHTAKSVGIKVKEILTGKDLQRMSDEALWQRVTQTTIFAEVDPNQKERIILALKKKGHVVGYMGDGINDVPALYAADVSISVDNAVDVAKESADIVLMEKSLDVLNDGIVEGRITFNNTLKYILVTTSANFGNMFSVAGISLILPFFPLLPKQILLLNFLTDFPALTLSGDAVDVEMLKIPRKWDIQFIRRFMMVFGLLSSVFDYLVTFLLFGFFKESQPLFQSGWFLFSILTELVTLMIMRSFHLFFRSRPSKLMLWTTLAVGSMALLLPYTSIADLFNLQPIPWRVVLALMALIIFYMVALEVTKYAFYHHHSLVSKPFPKRTK